MKGLIIVILFFMSVSMSAQNERNYIREGNKLYKDQKYTDAETSYRNATSKKSNSFEAAFNTANSLYKQGKYEAAAAMFDTLTKWKVNNDMQAKLNYNLGNSYVKEKKYEEGIKAYKNSLKSNPKDEDTKYNLSYAYKLLKKQQEDQKNKDKKDKDKKDNKDKDKKDQDKDKKDNKDKKDKKDQQNQDNKDQKQNPEKQDGKQQVSPEAAQQMLDAIQNDEKNVLKRLQEQKKQGQKAPVSKNW